MSGPERVGLGLIELPIALGVAFAGFVAIDRLGCSIKSCDGLGNAYLSAIAGFLVGIALAFTYWLRAFTLRSLRPRLALDAVAVAAGLIAYQLPLFLDQQRAARNQAASTAATERYIVESARARALWIESLKERAHGPVGEVPPMLRVSDDSSAGLTVTNVSTRGHDLLLARVLADPQAPGGWRGCALYWEGDQNHFYQHWLAPGATTQFQADARCADAFVGAPVEYRVGNNPSEVDGWWSDSAFAATAGRDQPGPRFARSSRRSKQPAGGARPSDLLAPTR